MFQIVISMKIQMDRLDLRAMAPQMLRMVGKGKFKRGETEDGWTLIKFSFLHRLADMEEAGRWGLKAQNDMAMCYSCHDVRLGAVEIIDLKPLQPKEPQTAQFEIACTFWTRKTYSQTRDLAGRIQRQVPELAGSPPEIGAVKGQSYPITFRYHGPFEDQIAAQRWADRIGEMVHGLVGHDGLTGEVGVTVSLPNQPIKLKVHYS